MTKLLLDFCWNFASLADPSSEGTAAMRSFDDLRKNEGRDGVPFLTAEEYAEVIQLGTRGGYVNYALLYEVLPHYKLPEIGLATAFPANGPNDLGNGWKRGLRSAMANLSDWRNPQIVACGDRKPTWAASVRGADANSEVAIRCEGEEETFHRVIVFLGPGFDHEPYYEHWFARSDRDPWDLQRTNPPVPGVPRQHPCCLPKPPSLIGVSLENMKTAVATLQGWEIDGRYYFIPPPDWQPEDFSQRKWRDNGETFRQSERHGNNHRGPCDYKGDPWWWDRTHRHWDVQREGEYWSISHTGDLIVKKHYA